MSKIQKILLVEDNNELRDLYADFLRDKGYQLETAVDGDDALVKAKAFGPELIFLDIMMPNKDGTTALMELRYNADYNATQAKIVLLTNLNVETQVSQEVREEADGFALKSDLGLDDLEALITQFDE